MRNVWTQTDFPFASWVVDIAPLLSRPTRLATMLKEIVELGTKHEVFVVSEKAWAGFEQLWAEQSVLSTRLSDFQPPSARMAWYDQEDQPVEGLVEDLGVLLHSLWPEVEFPPNSMMERGWPPLFISGTRYRYSTDLDGLQGPGTTLAFEIRSDIWFPFVVGSPHPSSDGKRYFDNRELSSRHTPRLNTFLAGARAAAAVGASWLVPETLDLMKPWINSEGISENPIPSLHPTVTASDEWWKTWNE